MLNIVHENGYYDLRKASCYVSSITPNLLIHCYIKSWVVNFRCFSLLGFVCRGET